VRRFLFNHPKVLVYATFGSMALTFFSDYPYFLYKWATMSKAEFEDFHQRHNDVIRERARTGNMLRIPFYSPNYAKEQWRLPPEPLDATNASDSTT
jgi:hypothetical protein